MFEEQVPMMECSYVAALLNLLAHAFKIQYQHLNKTVKIYFMNSEFHGMAKLNLMNSKFHETVKINLMKSEFHENGEIKFDEFLRL